MYRLFGLCVALIAALLQTPVQAAALEIGGDVLLGVTDLDQGQPVGRVDLSFGVPLGPSDLSLEVGTFAYVLRGKRPHETYAALVYADRWRAGVVRPAYDSVLPSVFASTAPYVAYERAEYARAYTTTAAMRRTAVPWGASYAGEINGFSLAASLHSANKGGFRSASLALGSQRPGWDLALAAEVVDSDDAATSLWNVKIGGHVTSGPMTLGVALLHPRASDRPDTLALDLSAPVSPHITLHALSETTRRGRDDAYGLAAEADLGHDRSLHAGATRSGGQNGLHIGIAQKF